jgi:hypothetical protein
MLNNQPNRGDVVKLPQGVITYKAWGDPKDEFSLFFFKEIQKPSVAIYVEKFNDSVSKLIYEDRFIYVYNEWLYELRNEEFDDN